MCDLDLLKKSISEDAKVALMNNLGPQNFERPTPNQPLVYTGDNVSVASIADNTVSSWASKRFGPKFSANWVQTQRDNNRTLIDVRIPEILDLALNVKYGGTSLQTANNILKGVDEDDLKIGYIKIDDTKVYYDFKSVNALNNNISKINQWYKSLGNTDKFWNKIQQDLQIPKQQVLLLRESSGESIEEKLASFIANYSYTIEINTAKDIKPFDPSSSPYVQMYKDFVPTKDYDGVENFDTEEKITFLVKDGVTKSTIKSFETEKAAQSFVRELKEKEGLVNTKHYSYLTVPGGTNYTENAIQTPNIINISTAHIQDFANGIANMLGWFRSDDKVEAISKQVSKSKVNFEESEDRVEKRGDKWVAINNTIGVLDTFNTKEEALSFLGLDVSEKIKVSDVKTRRILEVQSDLFQKGRDMLRLIKRNRKQEVNGVIYTDSPSIKIEYKGEIGRKAVLQKKYPELSKLLFEEYRNDEKISKNYIRENDSSNEFLQLLNKDNNWVTFFIKSIIQDSAKKGYERVVFPRLDTIIQIESGGKWKTYKEAEKAIKDENWYKEDEKLRRILAAALDKPKEEQNIEHITRLREQIASHQPSLLNTAKFYEETITNILKKQGYNPELITDEYGNTWNEIDINLNRDLKESSYLFQKDRKESLQVAGLSYLEGMLEMLSAKFGLPYEVIYDEYNPNKGYVDVLSYDKPRIIINAAKASHDTPLHEYGHIFINLIKASNKNLFSNLVRQVLNTKEGKEELERVKEYYSGYTLEEQIEETLVELLGRYAKNEFDPKTGIHKTIKKIWDTILEFLSKAFDVEIKDISPNTSIEQLAKVLSNPNINFNKKSYIEQNVESITKQIEQEKERLDKDYIDFKKIQNPVVIKQGSNNLVINPEEFNKFKNDLRNTVNTLNRYVKSQLIKDIEEIKPKIKTFSQRENFNFDSYPLFTKILPFIHPTLDTALWVLDNAIERGTLDSALRDVVDFVDTPIDNILNDITGGYGLRKIDYLKLEVPNFYRISFYGNYTVEQLDRYFKERISRIEKMIQDPKQSDSYYNRTFKFSTEDDTYDVVGKFKDGNIDITFVSQNYGLRDANKSLFFKILPKVIDSISYMFSDLEYDTISFTPVSGESKKGRDLRLKGYNIFAKRLFGQFSVVAENENTTIIPIPEMFKNRLYIKENLYQLAREEGQPVEGLRELVGTDNTFGNIPIIETEDIVSYEGTKGAAQYDGKNKVIKVNRKLLREKFESKAWTKPRKLMEVLHGETIESYAQALPEDQFTSYAEWEQFVINHEYQHSLYSRSDFDRDFPNKNKGDYETEINRRALNQMLSSRSEAQQLDRVQYLDELVEKQLAEGTKALVEMGAATTKGNETARATEGLSKLVDQINNFAQRIGVEYEILSTVEEAANVIGNANTIGGLSANSIIASGAPAFFYNGKVYFIAPRLSMGAVFHEFSHPIIKALSNVEGKKLFNSLYEQAIGTSEGQQILNQMLSEFPEGSQQTDDFKEELIIRALDKIYSANKYKNPVSKDFDSFTKKLFFAIKQFLRKVFGVKIKVENLSPSTTLEELAAMITGDKFSIDIPKITREDFVAFSMASKNQISEINKINDQSLFDLINDYQTTLSSIRNDIKTKNLTELKKLLVGDADRKMILSEVLSDLYSAKKNSEEFIRTTTSTTLAETQKTLAANTLARNLESISNIADILLNSIENINPTGLSVEDQKAFAGKIQYAGEIVSYLEQLFQNTQSAMKEAGIKEDTPEWQTITLFFGKLPALKTAINAKMISILSEVTSSLVTDMRDAIKRQAIADFKKAIRNNPTIQQKIENGFEDLTDADLSNITPQVQATILRSYKNFKSDYEAISKEALNDILSGNYKDNSRLNTLLESYTNNQNPVIGSFAAFYKQQQASAEALTVREAEDFMKGLRPLVEGMSQEEIANLGKDLAFEDKTFIINKDGDVEEKIVLTYLNRFKNYRFELKRREVAFEKANRNGTYAEKSAAYQELQDFKRKYFWQEYTQEYYTLDKIYQEIDAEDLDALYEEDKDLYEIKPDGVYFEGKALENPNSLSNVALIKEHISNIIGSTAFLDKQVILDSLNSAQRSAKTETELFEKNNEIEALQRMYRQLFSMTYEDGVTLKTGKDLIKTKLHIKYREKSNSFVEYKLIDGAFERSLRNFLDELALRETPGTDEYYKERDEWIRQNSQIEFTEDYYEERRQAIERLKAFTESKLPDSPEARLIAENYKIIYSMLSIFKDTDNAPDAIEMGPKRIANIKRLMEEIQDARDNMAIKNGLTKKEDAELQTLWAQIKSGDPLTVLQQRRFNELSYKQTKGGLSKADKNTYNKLIADVSSLTEKVPTQQYLDALNYWLNTRLSLGLPEITEGNANEYLDYDKIAVYFKRDPDFKNWFEANHILTEYYDYDLDDLVYTYKRVSAWEMARPSDEVYLKETQLNIIDEKTGKPMVLKRVPKARFKKRVVKDEFRLVKQNEDWTMYIGKYFDNRGRYLPRDYVPGDPNSAEDNFLINEKYDELRVNDPKKFAILEYMKKKQLEQESKLDQNYAKLYLDMPRYFLKTGIERRKEARRNIKRTVESVKRAFSNISVTDDVSAELLADDTLNMTADLAFVETDVLGNRREIIPIGGMSALETNQVSKDVIRGHLSRIIDIAKFNVLQDTSSVAKAFVSVLNNNDPKDMNSIDRRVYQTTGKLAFTKSKSKSNTAGEAMAYFYEREYLGKKYGEEVNPYVDQLVKGLMKQVSFGYFALDLASAAKNYFSQLIQNGIETAGGEYLDVQSLAMGKAMAYAHTSKNLFQRLDRGTKDLSTQMILAFEPIQDRYKDDFADSYTNSVWNELASLKLFMAPRRFLERESVLELFFGMMSKKLIDQKISDDKTIKIRYSQAFEIDSEGNMVLKKGVDERYAVGGSEFAKFRIVVQEKSNLLYGTYAKMDQPMAQKYFAFRLMSWLRRYFTSMLINRWGFKLKPGGKLYKASSYQYRYNWALNEMTRGYYVESMITLVKTLRTFGTYLPYMSKREAVALRKTLYDALAAILLAMLPKLLFGYDGGDDERFEKLKALSGPLGSDNFKVDGWLTQHAIYQMKAVFGETTTFIPIPGLGEQEILDVGTVSNVLLGRGIGNYTNLLMDLYYISTGDERAQYRRDMGPFPWQDKGDYKIYNHIGKMFGVKGKFWDPVLAIKAQETIEAMGQAK